VCSSTSETLVTPGNRNLLGGDLDVSRVDGLDDVVRGATVNGAADGLSGTEDLLDTVGEVGREGLLGVAHGAGDLDDGVELDVAGVLDVLLLLAVTDGLCERRNASVFRLLFSFKAVAPPPEHLLWAPEKGRESEGN
jgi:hypothetical protein